MQQSMAGLSASLGKHEHVIARLRQQLNESLAQHQQKLTQELARIIQATAAQVAAGASAGAAASAAAAMDWAQAAAAAACGSPGSSELGMTFTQNSSSKSCNCRCTCAITAGGAVATAVADSHDMAGSSDDIVSDSNCSSGPQQRWDAASLRAKLQFATGRIQLLQSQLQSSEAKLAMHRAAAVAAKERIGGLEGMLIQLQQQHSSKVLQTLLGMQQPPEAAAAGEVQHTSDCCAGDACCCGSGCQAASADGCASQAAAAAAHTVVGLQEQQQQHQGWELALSPTGAPGVPHQQQQQQLLRLQDQLRMAICDNTVLCYECMHLQHLLVQERFVGRSACQVGAAQHAQAGAYTV
jgi:hypothetical protein